ncbi:outer dense fiber protein 3-like protein 2 [Plutella xylostella]|uniref:outer dense fiber protein 3-like protein 2 n=1 Tax=Plutella xylostella TaxID=51655 RepID=UPI002032D1A9|nr:outer dense fiber protein 3-like protein 2 [Plutella xylostella]
MASPVGPGPGAFLLPPTVGYPKHDPSRYRAPMYSMGGRQGLRGLRALGPGPVYKIDKMTREGPVTAPAWSLGVRLCGRTAAHRTPGPAAYAPERAPPCAPRPPAYSLGARLQGREFKRSGPAPNAYCLRPSLGGPAYSLARRSVRAGLAWASPGPAAYYQRDQDVYKTSPPRFSLGARRARRWGQCTPGPAAYPPNLYNNKKSPRAYSFGARHSPWVPPMVVAADAMDCL